MESETMTHPYTTGFEFSKKKGCGNSTVYRALRQGRLNGVKRGGVWLVAMDDKAHFWEPMAHGRPPKKRSNKA